MKIITSESAEIPVTNVEVFQWLKEKNFTKEETREQPQLSEDALQTAEEQEANLSAVRPPKNTVCVAKQLEKYFQTCPSALVTGKSLTKLFHQLKPYKLTRPELVMISNIRPEAYAHLEALISDPYSRYEESQIIDMLGIINSTLEPRTRDGVTPKPINSEKVSSSDDQVLDEDAVMEVVNGGADADESVKETAGGDVEKTAVTSEETGTEEKDKTKPVAQNSIPTTEATSGEELKKLDGDTKDISTL